MLMYCLKALTKLSFVMIETMIEEVIVAAGHYYSYNVSMIKLSYKKMKK